MLFLNFPLIHGGKKMHEGPPNMMSSPNILDKKENQCHMKSKEIFKPPILKPFWKKGFLNFHPRSELFFKTLKNFIKFEKFGNFGFF